MPTLSGISLDNVFWILVFGQVGKTGRWVWINWLVRSRHLLITDVDANLTTPFTCLHLSMGGSIFHRCESFSWKVDRKFVFGIYKCQPIDICLRNLFDTDCNRLPIGNSRCSRLLSHKGHQRFTFSSKFLDLYIYYLAIAHTMPPTNSSTYYLLCNLLWIRDMHNYQIDSHSKPAIGPHNAHLLICLNGGQ